VSFTGLWMAISEEESRVSWLDPGRVSRGERRRGEKMEGTGHQTEFLRTLFSVLPLDLRTELALFLPIRRLREAESLLFLPDSTYERYWKVRLARVKEFCEYQPGRTWIDLVAELLPPLLVAVRKARFPLISAVFKTRHTFHVLEWKDEVIRVWGGEPGKEGAFVREEGKMELIFLRLVVEGRYEERGKVVEIGEVLEMGVRRKGDTSSAFDSIAITLEKRLGVWANARRMRCSYFDEEEERCEMSMKDGSNAGFCPYHAKRLGRKDRDSGELPVRCEAEVERGERCERRAKEGRFCPDHTVEALA
jgi:hypothetical protein